MTHWEQLGSETIFDHPRIVLLEDTVRLPSGEETKYLKYGGKHYLDFPTIIACRDDKKILLVEEYAYPSDQKLLQFPEGLPNPGESLDQTAAREFHEESGFRARTMTEIGRVLTEHRRSDRYQHVFLAGDVAKDGEQHTDAEEGEIKLHWFSENEIWELIAGGKIIQKNTLSAWAIFQAHKQKH